MNPITKAEREKIIAWAHQRLIFAADTGALLNYNDLINSTMARFHISRHRARHAVASATRRARARLRLSRMHNQPPPNL